MYNSLLRPITDITKLQTQWGRLTRTMETRVFYRLSTTRTTWTKMERSSACPSSKRYVVVPRPRLSTRRLTHFFRDPCEQSDNHFLEASGFLDSIQQVMKDFIVTTEARRESDHVVINDDVFAEIRQNIDSTDSQENGRIHHDDSSGDTTASKSAHLRQLRSKSSGDYNILDSRYCALFENALDVPFYLLCLCSRIFSAFSRAQSARDFLSDPSDLPQPVSPKDLGPLLVEENMLVVESVLHTADRDEKVYFQTFEPLVLLSRTH